MRHPIETLLNFLPSPFVPLLLLFLAQLVFLSWLEQAHGPYRISLRSVFWADLGTTLYVYFFVVPLCDRFSHWMPDSFLVSAHWAALPTALRLPVYIVAADLGHFGMHRLMHTGPFWRVHRWHHAADHIGFLACTRVSLIDRMFTIFPYVFFSPLLIPAPQWVWSGLVVFAMLKNVWMHVNVNSGVPWMEWLLVTPRYHHIHHSVDKAHHDRNLAPFFSIWDRIFGTYVEPEGLTGNIKFGIHERVPVARLIIGV